MKIGDRVEVISKASYIHYKKFGRITKILNGKYAPMVRVYFSDTDKSANFYESSLLKISI